MRRKYKIDFILLLWPIRFLLVLFGLFPYTRVKSGKETKLAFSKPLLIYSVMVSVPYMIYNFCDLFVKRDFGNSFSMQVIAMTSWCWKLHPVVMTGLSIITFRRQLAILQQLCKINEVLTTKANMSYTQTWNSKGSMLILTVGLCITLTLVIFTVGEINHYGILGINSCFFMYRHVGFAIYIFFQQLQIRILIKECEIHVKETTIDLRSICDIYLSLYKVNSDFNFVYWPQICMAVLSSFAGILSISFQLMSYHMFSMFSCFINNNYYVYLGLFLLMLLSWCLVGNGKWKQGSQLALAVADAVANDIQKERKNLETFNQCSYLNVRPMTAVVEFLPSISAVKCEMESVNQERNRHVRCLSKSAPEFTGLGKILEEHQLTSNHGIKLVSAITSIPLEFSAGLFDLSNSLFINFSGVAITNLVVLVQFEMLHEGSRVDVCAELADMFSN